ncbi:MAN1 protein [Dictyocaulus viviparus]|uniref:MAN1 protein n=1 Tax=Dictyocaulus viviparus TaxID=29172 RepID=A0A0D8Y4L4_DICVI|nr:MAN1 protein [Dictyocaulus viviparus]
MMLMKDVSSLSDSELRNELGKYDVSVGPITGTTRSLYEKKLSKLLKEGQPKTSTIPQKEKAPATHHVHSSSKSPARSSFTSRQVTQNIRRKTNRSENEDGSDEEESNAVFGKPVTSTPESTHDDGLPAHSVLPKQTLRSNDRRSYTTAPSSTSRSTAQGTEYYGDQPGATPPRKAIPKYSTHSSTRVTTTTTTPYTLPKDLSHSGTFDRSGRSSRGLLDFGNATGDEEDDEDDGQESSRYIYTTQTTGAQKRSPLLKAWDKLLGYDFKVGKVPGSQYELRHGSSRTRVERDPRTGRVRVQQHSIGRDISTVLMVVLAVFFVLLAIAYVSTARQDSIAATVHTISGAIRDTVLFFYTYAIVPSLVVAVEDNLTFATFEHFTATAGVLALYFGHKKWTQMKEKDEAAFYDLIDKILDVVREASENGEEYISIPHVRDVMFPPAKRRGAELARWERAVDFINANESRIATETRMLRGGQECDVWRWIPAKRTGWQGSAFAPLGKSVSSSKILSPNIPMVALTRCLKIRDMFGKEDVAENKFPRFKNFLTANSCA